MYHLKITTICHNFNVDKIYALFSVNSFSPETMVVLNFEHLEGLPDPGGFRLDLELLEGDILDGHTWKNTMAFYIMLLYRSNVVVSQI